MHIDMWNVNAKQNREVANLAYVAEPNFLDIERQANLKGFRKATILEINASADHQPWAADLFTWRGGVWISKSPQQKSKLFVSIRQIEELRESHSQVFSIGDRIPVIVATLIPGVEQINVAVQFWTKTMIDIGTSQNTDGTISEYIDFL